MIPASSHGWALRAAPLSAKAAAVFVIPGLALAFGSSHAWTAAGLALLLAIAAPRLSLWAWAFVALQGVVLGAGGSGVLPASIAPAVYLLGLMAVVVLYLFVQGRLLATSAPAAYAVEAEPRRLSSILARIAGWAAILETTASLFRPIPAKEFLLLALMHGLCWLEYRRLRPRPFHTVRLRERAAAVALMATSIAFSLVVLEVAVRWLLAPPPVFPPDSWHKDYLYLLPRDFTGYEEILLQNGQRKRVKHTFSSQGLRNEVVPPKPSDEFRIAMIGDSFTLGHATPAEYTIPQLLENCLRTRMPDRRIRVINGGVGGAGPLQELGMLRERLLPLKPDLVVLQFYLGNDLDDAMAPVGKRLRAYNGPWQEYLTGLRHRDLLRYRLEQWTARHSATYRAIRRIVHRPLFVELAKACRLLPATEVSYPPSEKRPFWIEPNLARWYPELNEAYGKFQEGVRVIRQVCAQHHVPLVAYIVPDSSDVGDEQWQTATALASPPADYERRKALLQVSEFLDREGITQIDVLEPLRSYGHVSKTYYLLDGHLSELGNRIVADALCEALRQRHLPRD